MKSKLLFIHKSITKLFEPRKYATQKSHCHAHMNELPIPCGPFAPYYAERQGFYNKILAGGAIWWAFSLIMMLYTNSFNLNAQCPAQPAPPSDMIQDGDDRC